MPQKPDNIFLSPLHTSTSHAPGRYFFSSFSFLRTDQNAFVRSFVRSLSVRACVRCIEQQQWVASVEWHANMWPPEY